MSQHTMVVAPFALDRTISARDELEWVPASLRMRRWTVTALTSSASVAAALAVTTLSGGALIHVAAIGAAAGVLAGNRVGRVALRRELERLAAGRIDLSAVEATKEGRLLHVRGRVQADSTLKGLLHGRPGVLRRLSFRLNGERFVHDAALDFNLVAESGEPVTVHVDGARVLSSSPRHLDEYPARLFAAERLSPSLGRALRDHLRDLPVRPIFAAESVLPDGGLVDVLGYRTSTVDPTAPFRLGRSLPMRASLRGGALPLLIAPVGVYGDDDDDSI